MDQSTKSKVPGPSWLEIPGTPRQEGLKVGTASPSASNWLNSDSLRDVRPGQRLKRERLKRAAPLGVWGAQWFFF